MSEAHSTLYSIHLGATKMYKDLTDHFWWPKMKQDVAKFVEKCLTCQRNKVEHYRPMGELQPVQILWWKWKETVMYFVVGLPNTIKGMM